MSKNITTTAAVLTRQGVSEGTVTTVVSGITKGMGTVGKWKLLHQWQPKLQQN